MKSIGKAIYLIFCVAVAMIGYHIHGSVFLSIINFILAPFSIVWWLISHDLNLTVIHQTFYFFLQ